MSMQTMKSMIVCAVTLLVMTLGAQWAWAENGDSPAEDPAIEKLKADNTWPVIDTGDNAWMLVSCALVLMMTAP